MTSGTIAGVVIRDQILGRENPWTELFDPNRIKPLASAREFIKENANVARRFVSDRITQRSRVSIEELAPGDGQVTSIGGKQVAVSRDRQGVIHAVGARCTHLGCIVHWNTAEATWDCPCHGSRFEVGGEVLEGPAVEALEAVDLGEAQRGQAMASSE